MIALLLGLLITLFSEAWDAGWETRWTPYNWEAPLCSQAEGGRLIMDCQSAAWLSNQDFDYRQPISISGTVYSEPGANSTTAENLAHFVLFGTDDGDGARYSGIYISYKDGYDNVFIIGGGWSRRVAYVPHGVHSVRIDWNQRCRGWWLWRTCSWGYDHYLDGQFLARSTWGLLQEPARVWLGASSVGPGTPNDGSYSHAEFGPIEARR